MFKKVLLKIYNNIFVSYSKFFSRRNLYPSIESAVDKYYSKGQRVISIGASGQTKMILQRKHVEFKEVDINPARKPDYILDAENLHEIEDDSVDLLFCLEVLEHVKNPFNAKEEIKRILKHGSILIASTPFMMPTHEEPNDFFRFTKYGILNIFRDFECLELKERNTYIESIYVIMLRLINSGSFMQKIFGILLFPVYLIILPFVIIFSFIITNKESTTGYFFVFRKKI